jgi:hypothetical protein
VETVDKVLKPSSHKHLTLIVPVENLWKTLGGFPQGLKNYKLFPQIEKVFHRLFTAFSPEIDEFSTGL